MPYPKKHALNRGRGLVKIVEIILAGTEGANSNTLPPEFEVTDSLIQSLIDLAHGLRKLGVRDVNGKLTYEEGDL